MEKPGAYVLKMIFDIINFYISIKRKQYFIMTRIRSVEA